jgi:hypothetical protein
MAKKNRIRLLILYEKKYYYLLSFKLALNKDGSFYLFFPREKASNEQYTFFATIPNKISYHPTGRVNFHSIVDESIAFYEPLSLIKKDNLIGIYSVADISGLSIEDIPNKKDVIFELPTNRQCNFHLSISPIDTVLLANHARFSYHNLFDFIVYEKEWDPSTPPKLSKHLISFNPGRGLFDGQQLEQDNALCLLHQKRHNVKKKVICYPLNQNGEGMIITPTPMRTTPKLHIDFENPNYKCEQTDTKATRRNATVKFKVTKSGNYLKNFSPPIKSIELDAEL